MVAPLLGLLEWLAVMSDQCRRVDGWVLAPRGGVSSSSTRWTTTTRGHRYEYLGSAQIDLSQQRQPYLPQSRVSRSGSRHRAHKKGGPIGGDNLGGGRGFLDVEFERVAEGATNSPSSNDVVTTRVPIEPSVEGTPSKSWIEWSLEADPELNSTRIPFFDYRRPTTTSDDDEQDGADFIDMRLAFLVELDGETYGIGTPFDHAVALTVETTANKGAKSDKVESSSPVGTVQNLPPTSDNEELMEIMATQLHESVGNDLQLVRTPRVLTVRGPLERYTTNWRNELLPEPLTASQLLDESDEDIEDFLSFMRRELGDNEVDKTLRGESKLSADDAELVQLFNIPGLGDQVNDGEGIKDFLETLLDSPNDQKEQLQKLDPTAQNAAIKLFSFIMPGSGKSYSLVSLMQPCVLVAKRISVPFSGGDGSGDTNSKGSASVRFELLPPEEEQLLIPRLEQVCKADLERAGLQLQAAAQETPSEQLEP